MEVTQAVVHRTSVLLEWLCLGGSFEYKGSTYVMCEDGSIAVECESVTYQDGKETARGKKYLGTEMQVRELLQIAGQLEDAYFFTISGQLALTKYNQDRHRRSRDANRD